MVARDKVPEQQEIVGTEEALARIMLELMNPEKDKLYTVSDATPSEIFGIPTLLAYAKKFKSTLVEEWVKKFLLLRVSRFRLGRREFLLLSTGIKELAEEKRKGKKVQDLFMGLK